MRHLGAVQSQLHDMALWALARRLHEATLVDLQSSFDTGDFVRTHVLRPTWHLVAPDDVHWLLALTGPRVRRLIETSNRSIGLTTAIVDRGVEVVVEALADGVPRTRTDLAAVMAEAGLTLTGRAMAHVVMTAETEALIVSGPMAGKQHTYRLLTTGPPVPSRDEMLADIARRYARGHGLFRDRDLAWWASLTLTDSRRAIDLAHLRRVDLESEQYWSLDTPVAGDVPPVMLLSNFDEYISYARDVDDFAQCAGSVDDVMRGAGLLIIEGRLAGRWTRTVSARRVVIEVSATPRITRSVRRGLDAEAQAFGRFVRRTPELVIT